MILFAAKAQKLFHFTGGGKVTIIETLPILLKMDQEQVSKET